MNKRLPMKLITTVICMMLWAPSLASAQQNEPDGESILTTFLLSYALAPAVGIGLLAGASMSSTSTTVGVIMNNQRQNEETARRYMQDNATALAQDMSMGGGQSLIDMAKLSSVEASHHRAFAKIVRAQRQALMPLLSEPDRQAECLERLFAIALDIQTR